MKKHLIIAWTILLGILLGHLIAKADEPKKENLYAKYTGLVFEEFGVFELGALDGYFFSGGKSKWPAYTRNVWHAHDFLMMGSMIGSYNLHAAWRSQHGILSSRMFVYGIGNLCLSSWIHTRGIRLVQTGKLFPPERGHGFFIQWKWLNIEVKSSDKLQWSLFGTGIVLLTLDAVWKEIFGD